MINTFDEETDRLNFVPQNVIPLRGHSNRTFSIIDKEENEFILRISRSNRSYKSVLEEEHVLRHLSRNNSQQVPRLLTRSIHLQPYLHIFEKLPGKIPCYWWEQCSKQQLQQLFEGLAKLHHDLLIVPPPQEQSMTTFCYALPTMPPKILFKTEVGQYVSHHWKQFYSKTEQLKKDMNAFFPWEKARYQWIHGDVQLENVLFSSDKLIAFLDFELVHWDACEKDVIFSAFRVCKDGKSDDAFKYDAQLFKLALDVYLNSNSTLCESFFHLYDELWKPYFCLDQALLYLKNAFEEVWTLEEGIGFIPCFNEVLHYQSPLDHVRNTY